MLRTVIKNSAHNGWLRLALVLACVTNLLACAGTVAWQADRSWWRTDGDATQQGAPYADIEVRSQYITMRDGVRLAADIYLPKDLPQGETVPTILVQTRYVRSFSFKWPFNRILEGRFHDTIHAVVKQGYAWVYLDARGTGASFGSCMRPYSDDEIQDGYEVADWIVGQAWSNGKIGAWGNSYDGGTALMLASTRHPAVKAVMPRFAMFDAYSEVFFPGGASLRWLSDIWSDLAKALDANQIWDFVGLKAKMAVKGIKPVDADRDGALLAEAVREHEQNGSVAELVKGVTFRDDPIHSLGGASIDSLSPHKRLDAINEGDAAFYCYTGWADASFLMSEIHLYMNLDDPNKKLTIGPWDHGGFNNVSPYALRKQPQFDNIGEILRFFDHYLRDQPTGLTQEKPVHYYTMGAEVWRSADTWPPPGAQSTTYFLGPTHRLLPDAPTLSDGADAYQVDPNVGTGHQTRWDSLVNLDHKRIHYSQRRFKDLKLLHYRTARLKQDVEVTGHPLVTLYLDSDLDDATVFVYLEDEDETGGVTYVSEGILRALHRKLSSDAPPYATPVPYRTFLGKDAEPLEPGKPAKLVFDLYPTSYVFKKNHRIRIAISGADRHHFTSYPEGSYTFRLHRSRRLASSITLPVMPKTAD
jgi:putative CocE/NonD family hydrolase